MAEGAEARVEVGRAASVGVVGTRAAALVGAMTRADRRAVPRATRRATVDAATRVEIVVVRAGARGTAVAEVSQREVDGIVQVHLLGAESEEENSFTFVMQT